MPFYFGSIHIFSELSWFEKSTNISTEIWVR